MIHVARHELSSAGHAVQPRRDHALALGLTLYAGTQLRVSGLPLGPGEMLMIIWLVLSITQRLFRLRVRWTKTLRAIIGFWVVLGLAECIGFIVGLLVEPYQDWAGIVNDVMAYSLMLGLGTMFALEFWDGGRRDRIALLVLRYGAALILVQALDGTVLPRFPGTEPWYYDRLQGWSENPNQLGLIAAFITILSVYIAEKSKTFSELLAASVCLAVAVIVGVLTKSDSYTVGLLTSGTVYVALQARIWLRQARFELTLPGATTMLVVLSLPIIIAATVPFAPAIRDYIDQKSEEVYSDSSQGEIRLNLWIDAIGAAKDSGYVGFGPGPHITVKAGKPKPPPDKFEAHNTLLDLFAQGGFVGLAAFFWICFATFLATCRAGLTASAALITFMVTFAMFHFVVRHPVFWFAIVLCLLEAEAAMKSARVAARSASLVRRPVP